MTKLPDDPQVTPSRQSRRGVLLGGVVFLAAGASIAAHWFNIWAETGEMKLSVAEAHRAALAGEIVLIDIRRPDEWALTGIGEGAVPIDMRRPDFKAALAAAMGGDRTRPVALICARGVRSRRMADGLRSAGFTSVLDVPEGMMGSGAGPGWLRAGLPVEINN
jgi:rhodanese-related sulfurtransferase